MFSSSGGIPPVKLLSPSQSSVRFTNVPNSFGIGPTNPYPLCPQSQLCPKLRAESVVAFPIDGGKVPVKLLLSRTICSMAESFDSSSKTEHACRVPIRNSCNQLGEGKVLSRTLQSYELFSCQSYSCFTPQSTKAHDSFQIQIVN